MTDRTGPSKAMFAKPTGQRKNFQLFVTSGPLPLSCDICRKHTKASFSREQSNKSWQT